VAASVQQSVAGWGDRYSAPHSSHSNQSSRSSFAVLNVVQSVIV
jgi:hypothetical protein